MERSWLLTMTSVGSFGVSSCWIGYHVLSKSASGAAVISRMVSMKGVGGIEPSLLWRIAPRPSGSCGSSETQP